MQNIVWCLNQHKALPSTVLFRKILLKHIRHDCITPVATILLAIAELEFWIFKSNRLIFFASFYYNRNKMCNQDNMLLLKSFCLCCLCKYQAACSMWFYSLCFVISLLQGSVLPEVIERLELFHHKFSSADELFDLLRVAHIFILGKHSPQSVSEVVCSFRILPSKKQQLQAEE